MNMCFEQGTLDPWLLIKRAVANGIVGKLNAHYGTTMTANIMQLNTSALGYFETLLQAVDTGVCDVVSIITNHFIIKYYHLIHETTWTHTLTVIF